MSEMELVFEKSRSGRRAAHFPKWDGKQSAALPAGLLREKAPNLPELSELDVVRHFSNLARRNFSVDSHFYPLGSCTMKYNPKVLEQTASLSGFANLHPMLMKLPEGSEYVQGALEVVYTLEHTLSEIAGMDAFSIQPMAGAHGEFLGIQLIAAYHRDKGNKKKTVIVPDSSHGTNPASAAMAGYEVVTVPSLPSGELDIEAFKSALNSETAAVMMTCPNTVGVFETRIREIAELAHSFDALMYYDGANLNAILGKVRPGDVGFDVVHTNVHKTFGTPHGGGGPGAGPVGVKKKLLPFLPLPLVEKTSDGKYRTVWSGEKSVGQTAPFFGNFGVLLKAMTYIKLLGKQGLIDVSEMAVLNANYIQKRLKPFFDLPYDRTCMHECVFSASRQNKKEVHATDIAKFLIDNDVHPPTVYFPLIVKEAMMIEPTETESKETLDAFCETMIRAAKLADDNPSELQSAPKTTPIGRPDETKAAREINVRWRA